MGQGSAFAAGPFLYQVGPRSGTASLRTGAFRLADDADLGFCYFKQHESVSLVLKIDGIRLPQSDRPLIREGRGTGRQVWEAPAIQRGDAVRLWKCATAPLRKGSHDSVRLGLA